MTIFYPNEKDPIYKIEVDKLIKPLWLIYNAFSDEVDIVEAFHPLSMALEKSIVYHKEEYTVGLGHTADRMITISQLLAACAMISNSFTEFDTEKDE